MRATRTHLSVIVVGLGLLLLATACGSSSSSSKDSTTTSSVSTTTSSSPITVAPATIPDTRCRSENLRGSLGQTESGAGQRYTVLVLANAGTTTCDLRGFPGVSLVDASGTQLGAPATREGAEGSKVSLPPGGRASATLHTSAPGMGATCTPTSTRIRVFPPDDTSSLEFAAQYSACAGFNVTTIVSGDGGR